MAIEVKVTTDIAKAVKAVDALPKAQLKAMRSALTRAGQSMRTEAVRGVAKTYRLTQGEARKTFSIKIKPVGDAYEMSLKSTGKRFPLIKFASKAVSIAQARRRIKAGEGGTQRLRNGGIVTKALQVQFEVTRGKRETLRDAFMARMPNNKIGIFERSTSTRLPIEQKYTLAVPEMFFRRTITTVTIQKGQDVFEQRFIYELEREMNPWK